jgi:hypothetical protein
MCIHSLRENTLAGTKEGNPEALTFFFFFYCCAGATLWHLQNFLQYTEYIIVDFTPSTTLLSPVPGVVSTGLIFPFTYLCTQYLHHIHLPTPFPYLLPAPIGTNAPRKDLFCPPVL